MKQCIGIMCLLMWVVANAADLEEVLAPIPGTTGGKDDFMAGVTWVTETEKAYYACKERLDIQTLELWVDGTGTLARAKGVPDRALKYGVNGPVQVLAYVDSTGMPNMATYLLLPSGEAHIFRLTPDQRIVKDSKRWQCAKEDWRDP